MLCFQPLLKPDKEFLAAAAQSGVPVFQTPLVTMKFINLATLELEMMFAPRATELGSMVDILGVGAIIRGESGIGKSEAVLALIERGYSLVADDVVKATLVDGREVLCTSAELTRDHMEVRGIGIINVAAMFGVKAIRKEKSLDLIITLKPWDEVKDVDRLGMEQEFVKVLGVDIPHVTIPVRPGPRHRAAHRGRGLSDQTAQIRLQRRRGIEQAPARADGGKTSGRRRVTINFVGALFLRRLFCRATT